MEIARDISGKFATKKTSRNGINFGNITRDELLNITTNDHVYFGDLNEFN